MWDSQRTTFLFIPAMKKCKARGNAAAGPSCSRRACTSTHGSRPACQLWHKRSHAVGTTTYFERPGASHLPRRHGDSWRGPPVQGSPPLVSTPSRAPPRTPPAHPPRRRKTSGMITSFSGGGGAFFGGVGARAGGSAGGLRRAQQPPAEGGLRLSTCARSGSARAVKRCAKTARACGARRAPHRRARARGALQCARRGRRATLHVPPLGPPSAHETPPSDPPCSVRRSPPGSPPARRSDPPPKRATPPGK